MSSQRQSMTTDGSAVVSGSTPKFSDTTGSLLEDSGVSLLTTGGGDQALFNDGTYKGVHAATNQFIQSNDTGSTTTIFSFDPTGSLVLLTIDWDSVNQQYTFTANDNSVTNLNINAIVALSQGTLYTVGPTSPEVTGKIALTPVTSTVYYVNSTTPTSPGEIKFNISQPFSGVYRIGLAVGAPTTYTIQFSTYTSNNVATRLFTEGFWFS